jgi:cytochrome bd-type quinol oxidase subunit 1
MYPAFDVPVIGGPWIIGIIAIIHVFISHFGVGGGLYLPLMVARARATGDAEMLAYLKVCAKFFLVVTGVYGASTGVGIWFAIGLVNPVSTSWLIHTFVMAWAVEWLVFIVEMVAITIYYYGWTRLTPENHRKVGWILTVSSWMSLVVINGILTFMLTPGARWQATGGLWAAYLNPTYLPSLVLRTLLALSLAAVWGLIPATLIKSPGVRKRVMHATAVWVIPAYVLMPLAALWYLAEVPQAAVHVLRGGMAGVAAGNLSLATRVLMVVVMASVTMGLIVYFGPWKNPQSFSRGQAIGLLGLCIVATGSTEWVREVLRKPYTVSGVMYSSGVRVTQVAALQEGGYLPNAPWAAAFAVAHGDTPLARGEAIFRSQCMACHTRSGYRGLDKLLAGRDVTATAGLLEMLRSTDPKVNAYLAFMPPLVATKDEAHDLAEYLATLKPPTE